MIFFLFPESCHDIINEAAPSSEPSDVDVWYYPVAEHLEDAYYIGYEPIVYKINGTRSEYWRGATRRPGNTDRQHNRVKCVPDILVVVTMQLVTLKGRGFSSRNFTIAHLPEGGAYAYVNFVMQ